MTSYQPQSNVASYQNQQQYFNTYMPQDTALKNNNASSENSDSFDMYTDSDEASDSEYHRKSVAVSSLPTDNDTIPQSQPVSNNTLQQQSTKNNFTPHNNQNINNQQTNQYNNNQYNNNQYSTNPYNNQCINPQSPSSSSSSYYAQSQIMRQMQQQSMSMREVHESSNTMMYQQSIPNKTQMLQQMSQSATNIHQSQNNENPPPPPTKKKHKKQKKKKSKKKKKKGSPPPPPPPSIEASEQEIRIQSTSILPPPGLPRPPAYSYASTIASDHEKKIETNGQTKRERAVSELIATEITYVGLLQRLIKMYGDKLKDNEKIISTKDHKIVFPSSLKTITNFNVELLKDFKQRQSECNNDNKLIISDLLLEFAPYFKMYQSYMNNSQLQLQTVTKCLDNTKFYNFQQQQRKHFNMLSLTDLIILPVQRIPRYKLLVQEIVKRTDKKHPDFDGLKKALALIIKINSENNDKLKDLDSRMAVLNITNEMEKAPNLSSASRKFIFCGELYKIKTNGKLEKHIFYLFNDCLVYAAPSTFGKKCVFKMRLPIDAAFAVQKIKDTNKYKNAFAIYSSLESFLVTTKNNRELRDEWMKMLAKCIYDARHGHYFHANSRNARMGRGSVLISQASLQIPKNLKKELNKELAVLHMKQSLDAPKKGKHKRFKTKQQIDLLIEKNTDKMQSIPERGNNLNVDDVAIYGRARRKTTKNMGMFGYSTGIGDAADADFDELSDDEKEFFMPKSEKKKIQQLTISQSVRMLPGIEQIQSNEVKTDIKPKVYTTTNNARKRSSSGHLRAKTEKITAIPSHNEITHIPPPPPTGLSSSGLPPPPAADDLDVNHAQNQEKREKRRKSTRKRNNSFGGSIARRSVHEYYNKPHHHVPNNKQIQTQYVMEDDIKDETTLKAPKQLRAQSSMPVPTKHNIQKPPPFQSLIQSNSAGYDNNGNIEDEKKDNNKDIKQRNNAMKPPKHIKKTKSVNAVDSNVIITSIGSPKASQIAKTNTFSAINTGNQYKKPKGSGASDALSVIRGSRFGALKKNFSADDSDEDDDDNNNDKKNISSHPKNTSAPFGRSQSVRQPKKVKTYTGDPTIWNTFLDQHNGSEPTNEWQLHKWIKTNKDIKTISFKQAREIFKGCKGRGKI